MSISQAILGVQPELDGLRIDPNVHAAVPVSQLFLASPNVGASLPATIWL